MYLDLGLFSIIAWDRSFLHVGLLTLWTNSIKIKAIKLQADFNDRQSRIVDGRAAILGSRCLGRCLFVAVFWGILRLSAVDSIVDSADDVGFRRKCFLNILYILGMLVVRGDLWIQMEFVSDSLCIGTAQKCKFVALGQP